MPLVVWYRMPPRRRQGLSSGPARSLCSLLAPRPFSHTLALSAHARPLRKVRVRRLVLLASNSLCSVTLTALTGYSFTSSWVRSALLLLPRLVLGSVSWFVSPYGFTLPVQLAVSVTSPRVPLVSAHVCLPLSSVESRRLPGFQQPDAANHHSSAPRRPGWPCQTVSIVSLPMSFVNHD